MVKKIGNIVFFLASIFLSHSSAQDNPIAVDVRLLNEQGALVSKTGIGIPTLLEVTVRGSSSLAEKFYIHGVQNFDIEQHGTTKQVSTINGVTTTKTVYRSTIRAQKEGKYTIGPVQIRIDGREYTSDTKPLEVLRNYTPSTRGQTVCFETFVDKDKVVVGQKVVLTVRFYGTEKTELIGLEEFKVANGLLGDPQGPFQGTVEKQGIEKKYIEWRFMLVPKVSGELVIPSLRAHYKELHTGRRGVGDFFGGLSAFLDVGYDKKSIYSPALSLEVYPLPASDKPCNAVGLFSAYTARSNQQTAKVGEGIVYALELVGDGDLESLEHPMLILPEALTYYASKSSLDASGTKKTFEYIVQGKSEGTFQIPEQEFVFFDTQKQLYRTLRTNALPLTITPGVRTTHTTSQSTDQESLAVQKKEEFWPLNERFSDTSMGNVALPWHMFWVFFIASCILFCLRKLWYWYRKAYACSVSKKRAYRNAYKKIKNATKKHDTKVLYDVFISFFAEYYGTTPGAVSAEFIHGNVVRVVPALVHQWDTFFVQITQEAYASTALSLQEKDALCKNAQKWINLFGTRI